MRNQFELCSTKFKRRYGWIWWNLCLEEDWNQAVGYVSARVARIWLHSLWRCLFTFNLLYRVYKCCTFNAICKDDDAVNLKLFNTKRVSFTSTLTGHMLGKWLHRVMQSSSTVLTDVVREIIWSTTCIYTYFRFAIVSELRRLCRF
jgi:hypothetical protein